MNTTSLFVGEYYQIIHDILQTVFQQERGKIEQAGRLIADAIVADGLIHVFGCGHSHMVAEELFYRAGGLAAIDPLFEQSAMLHDGAVKSSQVERMSGYAPYVLDRYSVNPGDVFIISSSSGINCFPIEMAESARSRGAMVIGLSSCNYRDEPSRDTRGVHLHDFCDLCINNHVPLGDAVIQVDSNGTKAGPVSSISGFFIVNSIMLSACAELNHRGVKPPIFKSGNVDGGDGYNLDVVERYIHRVKHL